MLHEIPPQQIFSCLWLKEKMAEMDATGKWEQRLVWKYEQSNEGQTPQAKTRKKRKERCREFSFKSQTAFKLKEFFMHIF